MFDKVLFNYLGEDKKEVFKIIIYNILGVIFNILISFSLVGIIKYSINFDFEKILLISLILLISISLKCIFYSLQIKTQTRLGNKVTLKAREDSYKKFIQSDNFSFSASEFAQLSVEGVELLRLYYTLFIPSFFTSMISPLILFFVILKFDWKIATYYLALVPLIPISIILVSKWAKKVFNKYWNIYLNLGNSFLDNLRGLKEIIHFNQVEDKKKELNEESEKFRKITMKVLVMQLWSITIMDLVAFGGAGIGIVLTLNSMFNGLNYIYAIFIILLGAEFFIPMRQLGSAFHIAMNGKTAGHKLLAILEEKESNYSNDLTKINSIELKNVTYNYDDTVLENINMTFNKGIYAISGLSGCGKSTIAKSLVRKNLAFEGLINIENIDLLTIKRESLYSKICYIENKTYIFNDTIRNNFLMHDKNISDEKIKELLDKVKLTYLYKENGLNYKINDNISNISGGERQRLALALYLTKEYDAYIFDEATSNIDIDSENIILDIINELAREKIVIIISHRLENLKNAKYIYYLEDKKIKEEGSFNDLIKLNQNFTSLYYKQKELELSYEA